MATGGGSQGPEFQVHVLGHPKEGAENTHGQLGACPFSSHVLLLLEEKAVPYTVNFVDVQDKPDWVSRANPQGSLPILKDLKGGGQFLYDSDAISDFLEDKYGGSADPEPDSSGKRPLRKLADCPQPGPQLWPAFISFLSAAPGSSEEGQARSELQAQLQAIEQAVTNESPFVGGQDVCAYDCALAPRLYLARQGCKLLKGWDWAEEHDNVKAYLHRMMGRPSWRNIASWDDECIASDLRRKMPKA
ncbi:hypothetical protein D9Q98_010276 [Chlorella vulgaris]|uniref:glutathione dehydrogenase (ascorbate) n=1 Tax=Chlorella vulgaris TaxID=3077 RepID=A0A9D4TJU1_CHLVU|nr:hypothetical protein D9Q98_010276 [Chlorella vulgaris]